MSPGRPAPEENGHVLLGTAVALEAFPLIVSVAARHNHARRSPTQSCTQSHRGAQREGGDKISGKSSGNAGGLSPRIRGRSGTTALVIV